MKSLVDWGKINEIFEEILHIIFRYNLYNKNNPYTQHLLKNDC